MVKEVVQALFFKVVSAKKSLFGILDIGSLSMFFKIIEVI